MERRDLIKDQIEQIGRVLGRLLADFLSMKTEGDMDLAIEATNAQLKSELDLDIDQLIHFSSEDLEKYILERRFEDTDIDKLANYLYEIGQFQTLIAQPSAPYFKTAKALLAINDSFSKTITFERIALLQKIEDELR